MFISIGSLGLDCLAQFELHDRLLLHDVDERVGAVAVGGERLRGRHESDSLAENPVDTWIDC